MRSQFPSEYSDVQAFGVPKGDLNGQYCVGSQGTLRGLGTPIGIWGASALSLVSKGAIVPVKCGYKVGHGQVSIDPDPPQSVQNSS